MRSASGSAATDLVTSSPNIPPERAGRRPTPPKIPPRWGVSIFTVAVAGAGFGVAVLLIKEKKSPGRLQHAGGRFFVPKNRRALQFCKLFPRRIAKTAFVWYTENGTVWKTKI